MYPRTESICHSRVSSVSTNRRCDLIIMYLLTFRPYFFPYHPPSFLPSFLFLCSPPYSRTSPSTLITKSSHRIKDSTSLCYSLYKLVGLNTLSKFYYKQLQVLFLRRLVHFVLLLASIYTYLGIGVNDSYKSSHL